ncbi:hypothetical protein HAX54_028565 [Datura stramonium]|uniref:Uncharacterized protein n=1 Tax=Datura stramonium TaxID=4076 RepID=A0ABS8S9L2_DATST|nr:hypothetical protein [Datura stramonium]
MKGKIQSDHLLLFELVNKYRLPRIERRQEASYRDLSLMERLDTNCKVNLLLLMIRHVRRVINPARGAQGLAYGFLLMKAFETCHVPLSGEGRSPVTQLLLDQQTSSACIAYLEEENSQLKSNLDAAHNEISKHKEKMLDE